MKMKKQIIQRLHKNFEEFAQKQGKLTYWYARDLQELLEYTNSCDQQNIELQPCGMCNGCRERDWGLAGYVNIINNL